MSRVDDYDTVPILQYVFEMDSEESKRYQDELAAMHTAAHNERPIAFHKRHLGRQNYTWLGSCRYWVWEGPDWRVMVSNDIGVCFEVKLNLTKDQVRLAWDNYRKKINLV